MPMAPDETGYNGQVVRKKVQDIIDRIDDLLRDPVWVGANNRIKDPVRLEAGDQEYIFEYEGQINEVEISTIRDEWTTAGWTEVIVTNKNSAATNTYDNQRWYFKLKFVGP